MRNVKKPKIAILSLRNSYNYGGVFSCTKVAYQFCEQYFDPTVFCLSFDEKISTSLRRLKFNSGISKSTRNGMKCVHIGARWAFWEPGHYKFTLPQWKKALEGYDYFFVVSGTCIAAYPLVGLGKKFTMWIGTPYEGDRFAQDKELTGLRRFINKLAAPHMRKIEKEVLDKSSYTWVVSSYTKKVFQTMLSKEKKENVSTCGYPIKCIAEIEKNSKKEKIILAVGRFIDPRKNSDMLMRTFNKIYKKRPDYKLYVAGLKPPAEKLLKYTDMPSFKNVIFTGMMSGIELHKLYSKASIMLITSHQEGLGIVGLEALLHGVPVISTDCGGTKEYVLNNETGFLVPVNDDTAMASRALQVLASPETLLRFAKNGQQLVKEKFSYEYAYQLFQAGLQATYPELKELFEKKTQKANNLLRNQTTIEQACL